MRPGNRNLASPALIAIAMVLNGCQREEGPAERAGKEIDKAAEKVGKQIENAGEKVRESARR